MPRESKPKGGKLPLPIVEPMVSYLDFTINYPNKIRGEVGAVKLLSVRKCDFIRKLAQSRPLRPATAVRRMHPRGMPHRHIAELNVQLK